MPPYIHKRFQQLAIYISDESIATLPFRQMLASSLSALYSTYLKGPSFNGIYRINIHLTSVVAEQGQVNNEVQGFLDYYLLFDFYTFAKLVTDQERQHYLLNSIQLATSQLAQREGWETARFEQAYHTCLNSESPVVIRW